MPRDGVRQPRAQHHELVLALALRRAHGAPHRVVQPPQLALGAANPYPACAPPRRAPDCPDTDCRRSAFRARCPADLRTDASPPPGRGRLLCRSPRSPPRPSTAAAPDDRPGRPRFDGLPLCDSLRPRSAADDPRAAAGLCAASPAWATPAWPILAASGDSRLAPRLRAWATPRPAQAACRSLHRRRLAACCLNFVFHASSFRILTITLSADSLAHSSATRPGGPQLDRNGAAADQIRDQRRARLLKIRRAAGAASAAEPRPESAGCGDDSATAARRPCAAPGAATSCDCVSR